MYDSPILVISTIFKSLFDECFVDSPVPLSVIFPEMTQRLVATVTFSSSLLPFLILFPLIMFFFFTSCQLLSQRKVTLCLDIFCYKQKFIEVKN